MISWCISDPLNVLFSTGGGVHRFHAQSKRTWPGKSCEEERRALRAACREGAFALHSLSLHCDPWPWQGPYQHWHGRLDDLSKRLFFYTAVIIFVIIPTEYLQSDRPLETSFFTDILVGRKYKDKKVIPFFCPNTVTAYVKSYTLYCIYAILNPA